MPHRTDSNAAFVADLARATIGSTTNQYSVHDPEIDREGGAAIRTENLIAYLERRPRPRLMLVGEAPSYRGCRFSGLAFTSERSLPVAQWSSQSAAGWQEPSATIVHEALDDLGVEDQMLLWNACPTHPPGPTSLSNRPPTAKELAEGMFWLRRLVDLAQPDLIVAVGQHASRSLPGAVALRHPSHGGKAMFRRGVADLLAAASRT